MARRLRRSDASANTAVVPRNTTPSEKATTGNASGTGTLRRSRYSSDVATKDRSPA
ncbi:hypothetical protein COSO111634_18040 [Corallococcus soli]